MPAAISAADMLCGCVAPVIAMAGDVNLYFGGSSSHGKPDSVVDYSSAEVEVMIAEPASRRRGIASRALGLIMVYAHEKLGTNKFIAKISDKNEASLAMFRTKLGFGAEAHLDAFSETQLELDATNVSSWGAVLALVGDHSEEIWKPSGDDVKAGAEAEALAKSQDAAVSAESEESRAAGGAGGSTSSGVPARSAEKRARRESEAVPVPKHMLSRLLYTNPVCLLTTRDPASGRHNVMTTTWITAIDNRGHFIASVNERRHSASLLASNPHFCLSVPVRGQEELCIAIGSFSGADMDKFTALQSRGMHLSLCAPGWGDLDDAPDVVGAVEDTVAHMQCVVEESRPAHGHLLLTCAIKKGFVLQSYWNGKNFIPQSDAASPPEPYMSFLGTKEFAYVKNNKS